MEFLYDYGLFFAKVATAVIAIVIVAGALVAIGQRQRGESRGHIEITDLGEHYRDIGDALRHAILPDDAFKNEQKQRKKDKKAESKAERKARKSKKDATDPPRKRLYVLDFDGDIKASATEHLREEVSAILPQIQEGDEVLLRLESPGGLVHGYGLAASQLQRFTAADVKLTVAVDKVAASGGYMMACVGQRIIAAPFAVIGSIGVLAQLPNFHRLLKKHDVDFELFTAGEYKRTLTLFGENTDKGREKFVEELEETHVLFKDFVRENRSQLDIDKVATGETWYGQRALAEGLVDEIQTSDAYIQSHLESHDVYGVRYRHKKNWQEKLGVAAEGALEGAALRLLQRGQQRPPV